MTHKKNLATATSGWLRRVAVSAALAGLLFVPMKPAYAITLPAAVTLPGVDLSQIKSDSKVVADLMSKVTKEALVLLTSSKDIKVGIGKSGPSTDLYQGLVIRQSKTNESFSVLGGKNNQRRNLMLRYEMASQQGKLWTSYSLLTDGVWGKGFTEKQLRPLLLEASKMSKGTTNAKNLGDLWDSSIVYGKSNEGLCYVSLSGNSLVKSLSDQLTGVAKNSEVKLKTAGLNQYELLIQEKVSHKLLASVAINFKTGELTVSSQGASGLDLFKKVANIGFKQVDPSGKTSYDTVFAKQNELLKEYERLSQTLQKNQAYALTDSAGTSQLIKSDANVLALLADKYSLKDQLFTKNGNPAIRVKVGVFDGWLYMKSGMVYFVVDFYPV